MSNFVSLNTGLSGLRAAQAGMDLASHNIANANTPGYTRQRVALGASPAFNSPHGPMGTGVSVNGFDRLRNAFLDTRVRTTAADGAYVGTRAELLGRAEAVLGEPDAGISVELGQLWDAFEDLGNDPANPATRQQAIAVLDSTVGRIRSISQGWDQLASDTTIRRDSALAEVNDLLDQIADIDRTLPAPDDDSRVAPNELLDERARYVDRLAELTGAASIVDETGRRIELGGEILVEAGQAAELRLDADGLAGTADDETFTVVGGTDDGAQPTVAGELGALHGFVKTGGDLDAWRADLDTFTEALVTSLNTAHKSGYVNGTATDDPPTNATPGGDLLDPAAVTAATVNVVIASADDLAAASTGAGAVHDGGNAQAIAALRTDAGADATLAEQLRTMVVSFGAEVSAADRATSARFELHSAAVQARRSAHEVSLDEEMVDLIRYQRALEAASRAMTTIDAALDVLINRTGLVGR